MRFPRLLICSSLFPLAVGCFSEEATSGGEDDTSSSTTGSEASTLFTRPA